MPRRGVDVVEQCRARVQIGFGLGLNAELLRQLQLLGLVINEGEIAHHQGAPPRLAHAIGQAQGLVGTGDGVIDLTGFGLQIGHEVMAAQQQARPGLAHAVAGQRGHGPLGLAQVAAESLLPGTHIEQGQMGGAAAGLGRPFLEVLEDAGGQPRIAHLGGQMAALRQQLHAGQAARRRARLQLVQRVFAGRRVAAAFAFNAFQLLPDGLLQFLFQRTRTGRSGDGDGTG